jgi:transposase
MLVELSVMEQRYHAVMEVISGAPVTEVARRYGVTRQAVHLWLGKYQREGLTGLADHSHRPRFQPRQLSPDIEAMICQLRGGHPRWGPRRLQYELDKTRVAPVPSRSTIYRVLVRRGLVPARQRKRRRQDYKRWQREQPMQLWQTSDRSMVSSGRGDWLPECLGVVVGLAGGEAVVKLAEVAVEQVAQRCGVAVAGGPAAVEVGTRGW